jgi:carbon storage regulator
MLVLSRKKNEVLMIGDNVSITIVEIRGDKIKLGIVAPTDVTVDRLEVWKAKQRAEVIRELKDN